ncbi:MAG: hypothetical protein KC657_15660 [Myxococcales bacterium]|nr:hypothetical protein [Myxococcales bacterium]
MAQTARSSNSSAARASTKSSSRSAAAAKASVRPKAAKTTTARKTTSKPKLVPLAGGKAKKTSVAPAARVSTRPRAATPSAPPVTSASVAPAPATMPPRASTVVARGYTPLVDIPPPPPTPKDFSLEVGDKAVHPKHGLGEVVAIEERDIGGTCGEFYILRILDNGLRVMVPRAAAAHVGLRGVMTAKEADRVLETMRAREVAVDLQPWSRRFRAYTEMIKCGSPHEIAKVLRDMYRLKFDKDLSFGERRLLDQAKSLLMKELALAKSMSEATLQAEVDEMFRT